MDGRQAHFGLRRGPVRRQSQAGGQRRRGRPRPGDIRPVSEARAALARRRRVAPAGLVQQVVEDQGGTPRGGQPFDRGSLHALLTNPLYASKLRHKTDVYDGEHEPVIDAEVFQKVQAQLHENRRTGGIDVRNGYGAILKRLLYCKACGHTMVHNFTGREGKRYRYYTCTNAIKSGRAMQPLEHTAS